MERCYTQFGVRRRCCESLKGRHDRESRLIMDRKSQKSTLTEDSSNTRDHNGSSSTTTLPQSVLKLSSCQLFFTFSDCEQVRWCSREMWALPILSLSSRARQHEGQI